MKVTFELKDCTASTVMFWLNHKICDECSDMDYLENKYKTSKDYEGTGVTQQDVAESKRKIRCVYDFLNSVMVAIDEERQKRIR